MQKFFGIADTAYIIVLLVSLHPNVQYGSLCYCYLELDKIKALTVHPMKGYRFVAQEAVSDLNRHEINLHAALVLM